MHCIIQARSNSKRLPNKVMMKINGNTIIEHVINQVSKAKEINKIIVATSNSNNDLELTNFLKKKKIEFFRGNLNNVAKRFINLIRKYDIKNFVRISADSPLMDAKIIDKVCKNFSDKKYDIVTNVFPRSYPKGLSVEVFRSKILLENYSKIEKKNEYKEHVSLFFYENSKKFKIKNISNKKNLNYINLSIDTIQDLNLIKLIFKKKLNKLSWYNILTKLKLI